MKKKILFICGSHNQTTQMHQIALHLAADFDVYFSPFYGSGHIELMRKVGLTEISIMGKKLAVRCEQYLRDHGLAIDFRGETHDYDLVVTCADLVVPKNIRNKKVVLVQEGMTDPENFAYWLSKFHLLPRWTASTAAMGLSDMYTKFCVASEGYRELFVRKGVKPHKVVVTGIPNFDNCRKYRANSFPHHHFVLVCTSDARETYKLENRKKIILEAVKIASGRQLIFKLHPNENVERASKEINEYAPGALIYTAGSAEEMIANCDVLITQYSSTVYVGLALGKEVYSNFDVEALKKLVPLQNNSAAYNISMVCRNLLKREEAKIIRIQRTKKMISKMRRATYKRKFSQLFSKAS